MPSTYDKDTIRRLAAEVATIAALPVQEEKRAMCAPVMAARWS